VAQVKGKNTNQTSSQIGNRWLPRKEKEKEKEKKNKWQTTKYTSKTKNKIK